MDVRRGLLRILVLAAAALALAPAAALAAGPTWLQPETIGSDTSSGYAPDVAADSDGNSAAAWIGGFNDSTGITPVYASVRPRGGPWGSAEDLDPGAGSNTGRALITALPSGEFVAVWTGSNTDLRWAHRTAAGAWSAPALLTASGTCCAEARRLVAGADGSATLLWSDNEGGYVRHTNTKSPGSETWDATEDLPSGNGNVPELAVAADGSAVAAWSGACSTSCIFASFKPAGGGWGSTETVAPVTGTLTGMGLAPRPGGEFTVVWSEGTPSETGPAPPGTIFSSDRSAGPATPAGPATRGLSPTKWAPPQTVAELPDDVPGCGPGTPDCLDLAAAGDGTLAALWGQSQGTPEVNSNTRPAGGAWRAAPEPVSDGQGPLAPYAAFTADGTVVAAWIENGRNRVARAAHRPPSGGWTSQDLGTPVPGGEMSLGDVAADGEGNAVTAWQDGTTVRAAGFDGAGPRIDPFSLPAGGRAGDALAFAAGAKDTWSSVSALDWGFGDGASASGDSVSHVYGAGGDYAVKLTATDAVGNASSRSGTVSVAAAPTPTPTVPPPPPGKPCGPADADSDGIGNACDVSNGATRPIPFKTATARVISGEVFLKLPAGGQLARSSAAAPPGFTKLEGAVTIPLGTTLDTSKGRVELRTAASLKRTETGQFFDGVFTVEQRRKSPWGRGVRPLGINTELRLTGASFSGCGSRSASVSAGSKRTVRRLWGDAKGRYRTTGRHAAATVRGTRWLVEDRCDGTLVRVARGEVKVRDLVRNTVVFLLAGQSYLARAR